jgi:Fic family protein
VFGPFEHFLHDEKHKLPALIAAGLIHVQFETIHPFLDGNGRLGRLLITLLLCAKGVLREPLLYLSLYCLYFETHCQRYYDLLQRVRTEGVWEESVEFFLEGTEATARQAADTAVALTTIFCSSNSFAIFAQMASAFSSLEVCTRPCFSSFVIQKDAKQCRSTRSARCFNYFNRKFVAVL